MHVGSGGSCPSGLLGGQKLVISNPTSDSSGVFPKEARVEGRQP